MHQSLATEYLVVTFSFYINISYQTNWVGQHTCSSFPATQACNLVRTQHTLHFFSFTITYTSRLLYRESFIKYYNSTILTAFYNSSSWLLSSLSPSDLPTYIYTKTSLTGWQHKTDTSETCSFFKMPIYFLMITLVDWTEKTVNFSLGIKNTPIMRSYCIVPFTTTLLTIKLSLSALPAAGQGHCVVGKCTWSVRDMCWGQTQRSAVQHLEQQHYPKLPSVC